MDKVLISDADYESMGKNVKSVFEEFPLNVKGKKVLVKPNILGPFDKDMGITTHPSLVKAVVSYLERSGAKIVVGDNPGPRGYGTNEESVRVSGILGAVGKYYRNIGTNVKVVKVKSKYFRQTVVSKDVLDCDILISLPKFKTHLNTRITGGIKNSYGILAGDEKAKIHRMAPKSRQFAEAVVDIYQIRKPDLVIMDAVTGMEGDGPNSKDLRDVGKLIASNNAVCLDAVMAEMMGLDAGDIDMLKIAKDRGLGEIDVEKINIIGKLEKIPNFKLPMNFFAMRSAFPLYNIVIHIIMARTKLVIDPKKCKKCYICLENCPMKAISENGDIHINTAGCISCYCCKELCPHDAVRVRGLANLMRSIVDRIRGL